MTLSEDAKIEHQIEDQMIEDQIQDQMEAESPIVICLADVPEQTEGERATGEIKYRAGYQQGYAAALCDISDHASDSESGDPIEIPWKVWLAMWNFAIVRGRLHKWGRTDQNDTFELPPRLDPEYDGRPPRE